MPASNLRSALTKEDAAVLTRYRVDADRYRAAWKMSIAEGKATVQDLIEEAQKPSGKPLLKLRLSVILECQPGWGPAKVKHTMTRFSNMVRHGQSRHRIVNVPEKPTLSWLLHPQSLDNRVNFWYDALFDRKDYVPWPGFPFTAEPEEELW